MGGEVKISVSHAHLAWAPGPVGNQHGKPQSWVWGGCRNICGWCMGVWSWPHRDSGFPGVSLALMGVGGHYPVPSPRLGGDSGWAQTYHVVCRRKRKIAGRTKSSLPTDQRRRNTTIPGMAGGSAQAHRARHSPPVGSRGTPMAQGCAPAGNAHPWLGRATSFLELFPSPPSHHEGPSNVTH